MKRKKEADPERHDQIISDDGSCRMKIWWSYEIVWRRRHLEKDDT